MGKERLEGIKKHAEHKVLRNHKNEIRHEMTEIKTVDYEWLIEQAERAIESEDIESMYSEHALKKHKQNQRYREAIFKALDALPVGFKNDAVRILGEALEGEE